MSNEELVARIKEGETELTAILWGQIRKLIIVMSNSYKTTIENYAFIDIDDCIQSGYFAMLNAINSYTPEKGYKFTSYLNLHFKNEVRSLIGTTKSRTELKAPTSSLNQALKDDTETELIEMLEDINAIDPIESMERKEIKKIIHRSITKLPEPQINAIKGLYFKGYTQKQTAEHFNFKSIEQVRQANFKALSTLRCMPAIRSLHYDYYHSLNEPKAPSYKRATPETMAIHNENYEEWRKQLEKEMERLKYGL